MTNTEKIAYLKGLAEGLEVDKTSKEGKLLVAVIDVLEGMAEDLDDLGGAFDDMGESIDDLGEALDQVSEDLEDVESLIYDDDWDDLDDEDDEEPVFYQVTCPKCGESFKVDEDVFDLERIECPECGAEIELDGVDIPGDGDEEPED